MSNDVSAVSSGLIGGRQLPTDDSPLPTPGSLKILHLEDNRIDAEIVRKLLATEFPGSELTQVSTRFAYLGELELRVFDIIVSDFSLESFNGFEALELARQRAPQVPLVFYSGTIGEDRAVKAMQLGVLDCVPKGQLRRLGLAISRALAERDQRRQRQLAERLRRDLEASLAEAHRANRKLEENSGRVQRLENIGLLAAGAAHDLNNMLAPVLMAVPLIRDAVPEAERRRLLDILERSTTRGAALVAQILALAQDGKSRQELVQPEVLVREIAALALEAFPRSIRIEATAPAGLWRVKAIPTQISQVLLNLCVNARDAMPAGGRLSLGARNCRLDELSARVVPGARAGAFVVLHIGDTGSGIPPERVRRIWEPLATLKSDGRETALGLPTVHSIVKRHGGFIQLNTEAGQGSSFRIYLPAVEPRIPEEDSAPPVEAKRTG